MVTLSLSRPRRTPSRRNLEIYSQVKILGWSQTKAAEENKITQSRVSRIVAQVEAWRMAGRAGPDAPPDTERRRHERWLARERWEMVFQRSLTELDSSARTLTSERSGERDGKAFRETTKREQAASVQWMKTAIRAAENLLKLSELEPLASPETAAERLDQQFDVVWKWLSRERSNAEELGRVANSPNVDAFIDQWLAELLGQQGPPDPEEIARHRAAKAAKFRLALKKLRSESCSSSVPPAEGQSQDSADPAASAPPTGDNYHNCHTPAAVMPPDAAGSNAADVVVTRVAPDSCVSAAPTPNAPLSPAATPKNPPDMTDSREPREDECQRTIVERPFVPMPPGSVMFGRPASAP